MRSKIKITALVTVAICAFGIASSQAASIDAGKTSYNQNCASCHGPLMSAFSAAQIRSAINGNQGGMRTLSWMTDADLQNVATFLANPNGNDSDRLFDWAEGAAPSVLGPRAKSQSANGYYFRYYSNTNIYLATMNGRVYLYEANKPANGVVDLGTISDWLGKAGL